MDSSDTHVVKRDGQFPYLILTLRRTGGTSLMGFLSRVSSFPSVQHEPFNKNRIWGHLTIKFAGRYGTEECQEALSEVLQDRPNIKHCLEIVPLPLTRALIKACMRLGYRIFVLSRRDEAARLRSLAIASATGIWGPRQSAERLPGILNGSIQMSPIDTKVLKRRAAHDARFLASVNAFLLKKEARFSELVFEDIYKRDGDIAERACAVASLLGIHVEPDDPRLDGLATTGSTSSTAEVQAKLPNSAEFEAALKEIAERQSDDSSAS